MDYCATFFPLFKVETIGDAYMIVGGMSENKIKNQQHAADIADFALLVREVSKLVLFPSGIIIIINIIIIFIYHYHYYIM